MSYEQFSSCMKRAINAQTRVTDASTLAFANSIHLIWRPVYEFMSTAPQFVAPPQGQWRVQVSWCTLFVKLVPAFAIYAQKNS